MKYSQIRADQRLLSRPAFYFSTSIHIYYTIRPEFIEQGVYKVPVHLDIILMDRDINVVPLPHHFRDR